MNEKRKQMGESYEPEISVSTSPIPRKGGPVEVHCG